VYLHSCVSPMERNHTRSEMAGERQNKKYEDVEYTIAVSVAYRLKPRNINS
jgi:hypothetical protein